MQATSETCRIEVLIFDRGLPADLAAELIHEYKDLRAQVKQLEEENDALQREIYALQDELDEDEDCYPAKVPLLPHSLLWP